MANYSLSKISGIGPAKAKKLKKACDLSTTNALLKACKTKANRKAVAAESGFDEKSILEMANRADLMRVKGVAEQYSDLLEKAGVDTVKELAKRNADNLSEQMHEINAKGKKRQVQRVPSAKVVKGWVAHAKKLKPTLTY